MTPKTPAAPTLFRSVRSSSDLPLVAFGVALLAAFALHAGAFLPRFAEPAAPAAAPAPALERPDAAFVASHRPERSGQDAAPAPCAAPAARL